MDGAGSPIGVGATAAEAAALACPPLRTGKAAVKGVIDILKPYQRPANATTRAQRELVQGQPCVTCGNTAPRQVADHKKPLVEEYYETGTIDIQRMRSSEAVQPQCPTCSAAQGGAMCQYSNQMREKLGL